MEIGLGSILLGAALLLLVALYVSRPFILGRVRRQEALTQHDALLAQKEALLEQIRLLDFEYETGKMPEDEHRRQRAQLVREAAAVLKELDMLTPQPQKVTNGAPAKVEQEIEAAIATLRNAPGDASSAEQIEAAVESLRGAHSDGPPPARHQAANGGSRESARFCPQCGNSHDAGDKFCAYCGYRFA